ncbi:hypothetical protein ACOMHN_060072 [Nucella lapillus]
MTLFMYTYLQYRYIPSLRYQTIVESSTSATQRHYTCLGYSFNMSNTAPLHLPGLQLQHQQQRHYTCLGYSFNISNTAPLHLPGLQLQHQQHSATTPAWATA